MKSFKLAQFECRSAFFSMCIYYGIYTLVIVMLTIMSLMQSGEMNASSGIEFSSAIFILVTGMVTAKITFKFTQANNLSRKTFFWGTLLSVPIIAVSMSIINCIFNRLLALILPSNMSAFDWLYNYGTNIDGKWYPIVTFGSIVASIVWQTALFASVFMLGMMFALVLYRCNRVLKIILAVSPVFLLMIGFNATPFLPATFWSSIFNFLESAFGLNNGNSYMAALSFTVLLAVYSGIAWLLTRRMTIKE